MHGHQQSTSSTLGEGAMLSTYTRAIYLVHRRCHLTLILFPIFCPNPLDLEIHLRATFRLSPRMSRAKKPPASRWSSPCRKHIFKSPTLPYLEAEAQIPVQLGEKLGGLIMVVDWTIRPPNVKRPIYLSFSVYCSN